MAVNNRTDTEGLFLTPHTAMKLPAAEAVFAHIWQFCSVFVAMTVQGKLKQQDSFDVFYWINLTVKDI